MIVPFHFPLEGLAAVDAKVAAGRPRGSARPAELRNIRQRSFANRLGGEKPYPITTPFAKPALAFFDTRLHVVKD